LRINADGTFKILFMTDLHLGEGDNKDEGTPWRPGLVRYLPISCRAAADWSLRLGVSCDTHRPPSLRSLSFTSGTDVSLTLASFTPDTAANFKTVVDLEAPDFVLPSSALDGEIKKT
jgi:hypothetical protein